MTLFLLMLQCDTANMELVEHVLLHETYSPNPLQSLAMLLVWSLVPTRHEHLPEIKTEIVLL